MKTKRSLFSTAFLLTFLFAGSASAQDLTSDQIIMGNISSLIRTLPITTTPDKIEISVNDGHVVLSGLLILREEADLLAIKVRELEGVTSVYNKIVIPSKGPGNLHN